MLSSSSTVSSVFADLFFAFAAFVALFVLDFLLYVPFRPSIELIFPTIPRPPFCCLVYLALALDAAVFARMLFSFASNASISPPSSIRYVSSIFLFASSRASLFDFEVFAPPFAFAAAFFQAILAF